MIDVRRFALPLTAAAMMTATACSDRSTIGPRAAAPSTVSEVGMTVEVMSGFKWFKMDGWEKDFPIDPSGAAEIRVGDHIVSFDANSICAINSTYGPTEWDKPCTVAKDTVKIHVKVMVDVDGRPRIDFEPKLRFAPGTDVVLTIKDRKHAEMYGAEVYWCPDGVALLSKSSNGKACLNEGLLDPSVRTQRDPQNGFLIRKVKHFSGYEVAAT